MNNQNYIEPTTDDLDKLKIAQDYQNKLFRYYKDERHTNIIFYTSLALFLIGAIGFSNNDETLLTLWSLAGVGLVFGGLFKYSYVKGEGKANIEMYNNSLSDVLKGVKCKWTTKDDKFYVYLEDGRKIEIEEY